MNHRATAKLIGRFIFLKPVGYEPMRKIALVADDFGKAIANDFRHDRRQIKSPSWLLAAELAAPGYTNAGAYERDGFFVHVYIVTIMRPFANITRVTLLDKDFAMPHTALCDACAGSGTDDDGGVCHACGGTGRVELNDAQYAELCARLDTQDDFDAS